MQQTNSAHSTYLQSCRQAGMLAGARLQRATVGHSAAHGWIPLQNRNSTAKQKLKDVRWRFQQEYENNIRTSHSLLTHRAVGKLEHSQEHNGAFHLPTKDFAVAHNSFARHGADIICLQDHKIPKQQLVGCGEWYPNTTARLQTKTASVDRAVTTATMATAAAATTASTAATSSIAAWTATT